MSRKRRATARRLTEVFDEARRPGNVLEFDVVAIHFLQRQPSGRQQLVGRFRPQLDALFDALEHYFANGFTYVEVGDGDELWENLILLILPRQQHHDLRGGGGVPQGRPFCPGQSRHRAAGVSLPATKGFLVTATTPPEIWQDQGAAPGPSPPRRGWCCGTGRAARSCSWCTGIRAAG